MAAAHGTSLQAIKTALDPLYASLSDEQKVAVLGGTAAKLFNINA